MKNPVLLLIFAVLAGAPFCEVCSGRATEDALAFDIEGVLRIIPQRYSLPTTERRVQINYRGSQWRIREIMETKLKDPAAYPTNFPIPNASVHTLSSDGTNIYFVEHAETNSINSASFEHPNAITNSVVGVIYAPGFPNRLLQPSMVMTFYAYLSTRYLNSVTNSLLDPIKFGRDDLMVGDRRVQATYKREADALGLPTEIVFSRYNKVNPTNVVFEASNFTNMFDVRLPMRVAMTRYARDGRALVVYDFKVSEIKDKRASSVSLRPELGARAVVEDFRFSHGAAYVPGISYGITTQWPTVAQAKQNPEFKITQQDWEKIQRETYAKEHQKSDQDCKRATQGTGHP